LKLNKDIEIIQDLPLIYIKKLSAVACSDLHLGYESFMASEGAFIPKKNLKSIKEAFSKAASKRDFTKVIITGDIKNDFSKLNDDEFNEFRELVAYLRNNLHIKEIFLIKGNHDNFIDRVASFNGVKIIKNELLLEDYLFVHGDLPYTANIFSYLIMGHIHPSIAVYNDLGVKEKFHCFLRGFTYDHKYIIVLPSMNVFSPGIDVNIETSTNFSQIIAKKADINSMDAICIGDKEVLNFGKVGQLRKLASI
jgi:putative SbcD/Mre11-related phosphoesterase